MSEKKQRFPNQFLGPSYSSRVKRANAERTVNMYLEMNQLQTGANQEPGILIGTPGLDLIQALNNQPIRATYTDSNDNAVYVVAGDTVYKLTDNTVTGQILGNVTLLGKMRTSTGHVSVADNGIANGGQVVFVDGQYGYFTSMNTTSALNLGPITGGSGYVNGKYTNIPLTGGSGTGLTADITVTGNAVTSLTINTAGSGYQTGDTLGLYYLGIGNITGGSGYTNGSYTNVPLQGGTGYSMYATIVVQLGSITNVIVTSPGVNYTEGDMLTVQASDVGGTGSGFTGQVAQISNNTVGINGIIQKFGTIAGGSGYISGGYSNVPLTGGSGTGATANFTVTNGAVSDIQINQPGYGYLSGDILFTPSSNLGQNGAVTATTGLVGGSGYNSGVYYTVPLQGGTGTGATATVTISGGVVTSALINLAGTGYTVNDVLTAYAVYLGGVGSGFSITVSSTGTNVGSGFSVPVELITQSSGFSVSVLSAPPALSQITSPHFYPASSVSFQDGYFIFNQVGTANFFISSPYSVTMLPLNVANKSGGVDNIKAVINLNRILYLVGSSTTETWWDSGQSGSTPFTRQDGQYAQVGCIAGATVQRCYNTFIWLGQSPEGGGVVYQMNGGQLSAISNNAIAYYIQNLAKTNDLSTSTAYSWQHDGHYFYVLNLTGADTTWLYDLTTQQWTEQQSYINGVLTRHLGETHCFYKAYHIIGDTSTGNVYKYNYDTYTDNGQPIRRMRQAPHIVKDLYNIFYKLFEIDYTPGTGQIAGTNNAVNPQVMLQVSDDGGETWGNPIYASIGKIGHYTQRARWNRLGYSRDRIFRVVCSDPVKFDIVSCMLDMEVGFG
jgi:hypothetical protein